MKVNSQLHALAALPLQEEPNTHSTEDWMGSKASLNVMIKTEIPASAKNQIPVIQSKSIILLSYLGTLTYG